MSVGIYVMGLLVNGLIANNTIYDHWCAAMVGSGVALLIDDPSMRIEKNFLFNNRGNSDASGIYLDLLWKQGGAININNNIIASNEPNGVRVYTSVEEQGVRGRVLMANNSIVDNQTAGIHAEAPELVVTNCIIGDWDSATGADDLVNVTATYSNIEDGDAGVGNMSANPNFVDANGADDVFGTPDDDYRITGTPCQDKGSLVAPTDDFDGQSRDARPDMGADEVDLLGMCTCDLDRDGDCDGNDLSLFAPDWGRDDCRMP
jgi:hypothetical protein